MKYVTYKDKEKVNLEQVITFFMSEEEKQYEIVFLGDHLRITWRFRYEYERSQVFAALLKIAKVEEIVLE